MADVNTAPKLSKNRKLGKNKKKSWRASNVEDVDEFLEDERRQIRTGGLVAEKANENLFIIDTGVKQVENGVERKSKRQWRNKQLKCYSLLLPDPNSKAVRIPDQENFQKGMRKIQILDRLRARSQSQIRVVAQAQRRKYAETKKVSKLQKKQLPTVDTDLWAENTEDTVSACKPPKRYHKKPSALKATVIPHPGASVNPAYEDHQDLLYQAHIKELEKLKKERKIYNALEAKFPSKFDAPNESTYIEEMSAGLIDNSDDEDDDEEDEGDVPLSLNPPVRREDRKTRKQRRVQKEQENMAIKRARETTIKRRENMILRIPSLKSDINKAERKRKEKEAIKQKQKSLEPFKTKRLGKTKFEEPDLDLKLSTELVATFRELKPEGHPLNDIYKSLQRRNVIEPRVRQKVKRTYKLKKFEKKGHKAIKL